MLRLRVLTAAVLLALLLPALLAPSIHFFAFLTVCLIAAAAWEWGRLNGASMGGALAFAVWVAFTAVAAWDLGWLQTLPASLWGLAALAWLFLGPIFLRGGVVAWGAVPRAIRLWLGWPLLWVAWVALFLAASKGIAFLLSLLVVVWAADIAAYFTGRAVSRRHQSAQARQAAGARRGRFDLLWAWGARRLAPSISPGKTWAGVYGALLCVWLLACLWALIEQQMGWSGSLYTALWARHGWLGAWICLGVLVAMSIVGDLFESLVKRHAGAKDSSALLPGHGGVLDRVDALLPVLPMAYWLGA